MDFEVGAAVGGDQEEFHGGGYQCRPQYVAVDMVAAVCRFLHHAGCGGVKIEGVHNSAPLLTWPVRRSISAISAC